MRHYCVDCDALHEWSEDFGHFEIAPLCDGGRARLDAPEGSFLVAFADRTKRSVIVTVTPDGDVLTRPVPLWGGVPLSEVGR